jgi:hypothetical protein
MQEAIDACRMLWPTLRDTDNTTATSSVSKKTAKVLAFPARTEALLMAA